MKKSLPPSAPAQENSPDDQTRFVVRILAILAFGSFLFGLVSLATEGPLTAALILFLATLISIGCIGLAQKGILLPGRLIVPVMIFLVQAYSMMSGNGLRANTIAGLSLAMISASLLLNKQVVFVFIALSNLLVAGIGWAEMSGFLTHPLAEFTNIETILTIMILVTLIGGTLYLLMRRTENSLAMARQSYQEHRSLLENIPSVTYMREATPASVLMFITPQVQILTGYSSAEFLENPDLWLNILHPDDREDFLVQNELSSAGQKSISRDFRFITRLGEVVWVHDEAVLVHSSAGQPAHWLGVWTNINERKIAEESLNQREAILEAVAFAAERFLEVPDWRANIHTVLEHLGCTIHASHAYLFENFTAPNGVVSSRIIYEWAAPGYKSDLDEEIYQDLPINEEGFETWYKLLSAREPFVGGSATMPDEERDHLNVRGILAILDVPIFVNGQWWGTIGFDEMAKAREWSIAEVDALKVAAEIISTAVQRHLSDLQRQQTEEIYRQTIESTGAVPYYEDYASNAYAFMGKGIQELTGYSSEEITPDLWQRIAEETIMIGENANLGIQDAIKLAREGGIKVWKCDFHIHRRDGQLRWIADTAVEIINASGTSEGSVGILMDVTDRRQMEDRIRHLNIELEQRVKDRTAQLEATNKELEAFSYSVSHDLRAPLRAVRGYSQILVGEFGNQLPQEAREMLIRVSSAAQQMSELIESLLALSRLTRGNLNRRELDLSSMANAIFDNLKLHESERTVTCRVENGLRAYADERLMTTALENLLGNAWKYSSKTENAFIEFGTTVENGKKVFFVRDNGAGFNMKYAEKLFGAFQRLHTDLEFPGHGVGLATVQRILRRHGGEIWAVAETGKGATFYFTLE